MALRLPTRTWLALPAILVTPLLLGACGGSARPAPPSVRLTIDSPADGATTLAGNVYVSGSVEHGGATVLIGGRQVSVSGGNFGAQIPIRPGANVIDVLAGAPRAQEAMSAVRVYRQVTVAVPDVSGESPSAASAALARAGFQPSVQNVGGFFQSLIPASSQVCQTVPPPGRLLAPHSTVQVQVAKIC